MENPSIHPSIQLFVVLSFTTNVQMGCMRGLGETTGMGIKLEDLLED